MVFVYELLDDVGVYEGDGYWYEYEDFVDFFVVGVIDEYGVCEIDDC